MKSLMGVYCSVLRSVRGMIANAKSRRVGESCRPKYLVCCRSDMSLMAVLISLCAGALPLSPAHACTPTESSFVGNGANGTSGVTYEVRTFSTVGTCNWQIPAGVDAVDVLVVGGGGGGGTGWDGWPGGGGGAGGLIERTVALTC